MCACVYACVYTYTHTSKIPGKPQSTVVLNPPHLWVEQDKETRIRQHRLGAREMVMHGHRQDIYIWKKKRINRSEVFREL